MATRYHQALKPSSPTKFDAVLVINIMVADGCGNVLGGTIRVSGW